MMIFFGRCKKGNKINAARDGNEIYIEGVFGLYVFDFQFLFFLSQ